MLHVPMPAVWEMAGDLGAELIMGFAPKTGQLVGSGILLDAIDTALDVGHILAQVRDLLYQPDFMGPDPEEDTLYPGRNFFFGEPRGLYHKWD